MNIIEVPISEVRPNENNPRTITNTQYEKLKNSIREFPEMLKIRPIVVKDGIALGGNMRLKALTELGFEKVPVINADDLTEDQVKEFIIKDNVSFGNWDWDVLANEWNSKELDEWGLETWQNMDDIETEDAFDLPSGDKPPFQQQTYTLADEQAIQIKNAIADIKKTEEFKYVETFGNENSNGNALYLIIMQWVEQSK